MAADASRSVTGSRTRTRTQIGTGTGSTRPVSSPPGGFNRETRYPNSEDDHEYEDEGILSEDMDLEDGSFHLSEGEDEEEEAEPRRRGRNDRTSTRSRARTGTTAGRAGAGPGREANTERAPPARPQSQSQSQALDHATYEDLVDDTDGHTLSLLERIDRQMRSDRPHSPPQPRHVPAAHAPSQPFPMLRSDRHSNSQSASTSSSSSGSEPVEINPETGERRFTRREKGKSRAIPIAPINLAEEDDEALVLSSASGRRGGGGGGQADDIGSEGDDEIVHVGIKRKADAVGGLAVDKEQADMEASGEDKAREGTVAREDDRLDQFCGCEQSSSGRVECVADSVACPVCFCPPSKAVMTPW